MADDDDVDMSLFLTVVMENMSAGAIDIILKHESKVEVRRRLELGIAYPMVMD